MNSGIKFKKKNTLKKYFIPCTFEQIEYMINYGNTMIFDLFVCLLIACGNTFINSALKYYIFDENFDINTYITIEYF